MSAETLRSAVISRSWFHTIFFSVIGLGLLALAFYLWQDESPGWGVLSGIIGGCVLLTGLISSGESTCPVCHTKLFQLMKGAVERCQGCGTYFDVSGSLLQEVELDRVQGGQDFTAPLPDSWVMPDLCCVCGQEAEREEEITIKLSYPSQDGMGLMRDLVTHGVRVPHCSQHQGGAKLDSETPKEELSFESLAGTTGVQPRMTVLKVRSYRFYQAFISLNRLFPKHENSFVANDPDS